ncbi:MAG: sulfite exporter TauE/SafE family protein [Deltaproteobacteria bacterium]|nr:sulfite exporter TauE/SafE family protein [Deltaproteobacteria bacterium]
MRGLKPIALAGIVFGILMLQGGPGFAAETTAGEGMSPYLFSLIVFLVCTGIGTIAIIAGTGGGVLFTTLFLGFTSIHPDIVRATGLLAAVCGTRIGARRYLRKGVANIRLVLLLGSCYALFAVIGAVFGLTITRRFGDTGIAAIKLSLGIIVMAVGVMYLLVKGTAYPEIEWVDRLTRRLGLDMAYWEESLRRPVSYRVTRALPGALVVCVVGFISGTLGLGAGWAITPLFNFVMLVPLKVAAASSAVIISLGDTAAIFPYLMSNSIFPVYAVPTITGLILGAEIGSRIAIKVKPQIIRYVLIAIMLGTGVKLVITGASLL